MSSILETELKLELDIDLPVLWSFCNRDQEASNNRGIVALKETYESIEKLSKRPLLHPEANRRVIAVSFVPDDKFEKSTKTYSIMDYKNETYLEGRSYSVDKLKSGDFS